MDVSYISYSWVFSGYCQCIKRQLPWPVVR